MRHGLRERVAPILAFGGTAAALPALLLHYFGRNSAAIHGGWHFFGGLVSDLGGFPSAARRLVPWSHEDALALLRAEAGRSLDGDCVEALERVLSWEREPEPEPARRPTSVRRGRTRPATPAAETS